MPRALPRRPAPPGAGAIPEPGAACRGPSGGAPRPGLPGGAARGNSSLRPPKLPGRRRPPPAG
ncbi:hypothetical protein CXU21_08800 [Akkermansia muciniphila]|nr:hypothetical protein CXU21_08800 [Akkermansia muciniphila]